MVDVLSILVGINQAPKASFVVASILIVAAIEVVVNINAVNANNFFIVLTPYVIKV